MQVFTTLENILTPFHLNMTNFKKSNFLWIWRIPSWIIGTSRHPSVKNSELLNSFLIYISWIFRKESDNTRLTTEEYLLCHLIYNGSDWYCWPARLRSSQTDHKKGVRSWHFLILSDTSFYTFINFLQMNYLELIWYNRPINLIRIVKLICLPFLHTFCISSRSAQGTGWTRLWALINMSNFFHT